MRTFFIALYLQREHLLASGWTSPWCNQRSALGTWALGCGTSPQLARSTGPHGDGVARVTWSSRRGSRWSAVAWGILASWRGWDRRESRQSRPERTGWTPEKTRQKKKKWQWLEMSRCVMCPSCSLVSPPVFPFHSGAHNLNGSVTPQRKIWPVWAQSQREKSHATHSLQS